LKPNPLRFASLSSGSSGNAAMIAYGDTRYLIDAGISVPALRKRLFKIGETDTGFRGIFLTHSHRDHAAYAAEYAKHLFCPVFCSEATSSAITDGKPWNDPQSEGKRLKLDGLNVKAITVPHIAGSVAYIFTHKRKKIVFAHDLGSIPKDLIRASIGAHFIAIEANYCDEMLQATDRVQALKDRIASDTGHLSNAMMAHFLQVSMTDKLQAVAILHLSSSSNDPERAVAAARAVLPENVCVFACPQDEPVAWSF
jgi:phosphoribosyl 1,2-cyclic phosphodiesterase